MIFLRVSSWRARMLRMSKLRAVWERVEVRIGSIAIIQSIMSLGCGDGDDALGFGDINLSSPARCRSLDFNNGETPLLPFLPSNVGIAILNHPPNHHFYGWDSNHQKWIKIGGLFMALLYPHYSSFYS